MRIFTISTTPETTLSLVSESVNNLIFNSANKTVTAKANLAAGTYTLRLKAEAQYYTPFLFDVVVEVVPAAEVAWTVAGADGAEISPDKTGVYQLPVNRSEGGSFTVSTVPANAKVTRTDKNAEITSGDNRTFTVPANLSGDSLQVTLKGTNKNYLPSEITISVNLVSDARLTPPRRSVTRPITQTRTASSPSPSRISKRPPCPPMRRTRSSRSRSPNRPGSTLRIPASAPTAPRRGPTTSRSGPRRKTIWTPTSPCA